MYNTAALFTSVTRVIVAVQPGQSVELSALVSPAWKMARAAGVRLALTMTALGSPEIVSTYDNTGGEGVTVGVCDAAEGDGVRESETVGAAEDVAVPEAVAEGETPVVSEDVEESVEVGVPVGVCDAPEGDGVREGETGGVAEDAAVPEAVAEGGAPNVSEDVEEGVGDEMPEEVGDAPPGEAMAEGVAVVAQPYTIEGSLHPFVLQAMTCEYPILGPFVMTALAIGSILTLRPMYERKPGGVPELMLLNATHMTQDGSDTKGSVNVLPGNVYPA